MTRRLNVLFVTLIAIVLLALTFGVGAVVLDKFGEGAAGPVQLTVFVGSAKVQRAGSETAAPGHSGDRLSAGDSVTTGEATKVQLRYPDGSVTRLDSTTTVLVNLARVGADGTAVTVRQSSGLSWNRVQKLIGGSTFKVDGPNNASAGVRGTGFGYYVEKDAAGNPVIWIDVYEGIVAVAGGAGASVAARAGERVTVRPASAPTTPVPIPDSDNHIEFTVFNRALEATPGDPYSFSTGTLSPGGTSATFSVLADGRTDLSFVLAAPPGSNFGLTVTAPDGKIFFDSNSPASPLVAFAPKATAGTWKYRVRDIQSPPQDPFWVVVGRK